MQATQTNTFSYTSVQSTCLHKSIEVFYYTYDS